MLDLVNMNMCTAKCPCNATAYNAGYKNMASSNFTYNGRSSQVGSGSVQGRKKIVTASTGASFSDFQTCYMKNLASTYPKDKNSQNMAYL